MAQDVRIGEVHVPNGLVLAPMAGATNSVFRMLCKELGAGLTITEMVSAKGLVMGNSRTEHYLHKHEAEKPVGAQIFGDDPNYMAEAARRIEQSGFDLVDVNMGCPVPKITEDGGGCSLMKEPQKAASLIESMRKAVKIPVTVKIRAGWDEQQKNAPEMARILEGAGACAITVHGRTREQKYSGKADWNLIRQVKQSVQVPVFGNGDVDSAEKAGFLLQESGCDGLTIGRTALNRPWIFREIASFRRCGTVPSTPTPEETGQFVLRLANGLMALYGEATAVLMMRRYASEFSKGFVGGSSFRPQLMKTETIAQFKALVEGFFLRASLTGEASPARAGD